MSAYMSPINPLSGCRFHTRCPFAVERQKSGSFHPRALPGLTGRTTLSDSRPARRAYRAIENLNVEMVLDTFIPGRAFSGNAEPAYKVGIEMSYSF